MNVDTRPGIMSQGYAARNFDAGPKTYSDQGFMDMIHKATGLADFQGQAVVLDLMSGPAKVSLGLKERSPQHRYIAVDASEGQLLKVPDGIERLQADVRDLSVATPVDVVVVRYGLKDIPQDQQPGVLEKIFQVTRPGGRLVVIDMVSPDGMKARTNKQHSLKQELGIIPRDVATEGRCNIPTEDQWFDLLENAGFRVSRRWDYVSRVNTSDWVNGNQISKANRRRMDSLLANQPLYFRDRFKVVRDGRDPASIEYPVLVIRAEKPTIPVARDLFVYGSDSVVRYGRDQVSRPGDNRLDYRVHNSQ